MSDTIRIGTSFLTTGGERLHNLTENASVLAELAMDLTMAWRGVAYTASLPLATLDHTKVFHDTFVQSGELNTQFLKLMETVPKLLASKIPRLSSDPELIRRLQQELLEISVRVSESDACKSVELPLEELWDAQIQEPAFQLSVWGSQRICYSALWGAYENFLVRCVRIAVQNEGIRSTDRSFNQEVVNGFGQQIRDVCWTNNEFAIARLARHSLLHAGGRVTENLAKQKHGFVVADDRIQVMPENIKSLFTLLKDAAFELSEAAVKMPGF
jgi:hypothetical protein